MLKKVVWFTGMSGVGKTTISDRLLEVLKKKNYKATKIDGDRFRKKKS